MPLMCACLARLGSRYSLILDPVRRQVQYGALGLFCQMTGEMVIALDDAGGGSAALPLAKGLTDFDIVDMRQTMTSLTYEAHSVKLGVKLTVEFVAPFWPQDEPTSTVPAYLVNFTVARLDKVRWRRPDPAVARKGILRFALKLPQAKFTPAGGGLQLRYPVLAGRLRMLNGTTTIDGSSNRTVPHEGSAADLIAPLEGRWRAVGDAMEAEYDVSAQGASQTFSLILAGYCPDALFDRFGKAMALKYTRAWPDAAAVAEFVRGRRKQLIDKSRRFDAIWAEGPLPGSAADLTAYSFQSYLMCSMWASAPGGEEFFSVWEGSCWFNSTVDVTYNEAMFYFACWPQLLEMIFEEWSRHANDSQAETARLQARAKPGQAVSPQEFPGRMLQHDMGAGWTACGQSYPHAMPVEENANFLLLLYAHGRWWGREKLFARYDELNRRLVEYLLWTDSKGNGFPDRGVANTIDDATPAVQFGRDNVYLGIKRLAALHAAARMFEHTGQADWARRCRAEVRKAVKTLNAHWLGDHWGVCLDKSAKGLVDPWTGQALPYKTVPGWDAYSLYTTNGLLPLMMVDDMPQGIGLERLRTDAVRAAKECLTTYGCGHSSLDKTHMWVAMNLWRDCAAGYLGENMLSASDRYWKQQVFANGPGGEKPNCFTETTLSNDLTSYPRGAASFGLMMSAVGLQLNGAAGRATVAPVAAGRWPLLPLADWKKGRIPFANVESKGRGRLVVRLEADTGPVKVKVVR